MPFSIIRNDITKVKADAIVNTANLEVAIGDGIDAAIYKAAGEEKLYAARREIGVLEPGEVGITPAFGLDAKYIIHVSGPCWEGGDYGEERLLRQCYDKSLELAAENGCKSIAFPLLATGTYGFPKELGIQIAIDAFTAFLKDHEMEITLVVFREYAYHVSGKLFDDVKSFIDNEYVSGALEDEYSHDGIPEDQMVYLQRISAFSDKEESKADASEVCDEDDGYFADWEDEEETDAIDVIPIGRKYKAKESAPMAAAYDECHAEMMFGAAKESQSLDDALKEMYTDTFEKHLQQLINKKGLKNSEIYTAANISKQYFSKLLKGQVKPSKEKVLSLAVGLRLNLDETVDFLRLAGYALSPISQTDVVVKYFIVHKDYSVMKIDVALFDYGLDPLSKG
ncbi:macro domain-containing protein [Butyrivibrio sp. AC2005]|uniref:macro domain-containing protein n=1 Tax=Butyrivibrio sp. AC2005 TaxID=1280672 RepID=UPI0004206A18|nr:macro domain-containing protein [Butyrivibrio sp. AC2005]